MVAGQKRKAGILMKSAYNKEIWRAIRKGKKRFFSIMLITILGVGMLTGLRAACMDLRYSADQFYDRQGLYDISVVSTLGLTEKDVDALKALDGVADAVGVYSETVHAKVNDHEVSIAVCTLNDRGINQPYVLSGRLPESADETAVTTAFADETGCGIGDVIAVDTTDDEESSLLCSRFTVTGIVVDVQDVNNAKGATAFRSGQSEDDTVFILPEAADSDIYTQVCLTVHGAAELFCYSDAYEEKVAQVTDAIETQIKENREQARYVEVTDEAKEKLADAKAEAEESFAEAEQQLSDARAELDKGWQELSDGQEEFDAEKQQAEDGFAEARDEIAAGKQQIADGSAQLDAAEQQLSEGEAQVASGKQTLSAKEEETYAQLDAARAQLTESSKQAAETEAALEAQAQEVIQAYGEAWPAEAWDAYVQAAVEAYLPVARAVVAEQDASQAQAAVPGLVADSQSAFLEALQQPTADQLVQLAMGLGNVRATIQALGEAQAQLDTAEQTARQQFDAAWNELNEGEAQIIFGKSQIADKRAELENGSMALSEGEAQLAQKEQETAAQIKDGEENLAEGREKLLEGETEYADGKAEYEENLADFNETIAEEEQKIADIDMTQWYVQDRTSLSGYANVKSDAASIEAIGTVFPMVFFVVAILISLTTITRMVEEDRGLIGTYKALGFTDREIRRKYLVYACAASVSGGILGNVCGFVLLPEIIFRIFDTMYLFPEYLLRFMPLLGCGGAALFAAGIVIATACACKAELVHMPAVLMRPKAPRAGSRVLLERITPVWKRLSFLNKVTARNLFRYKKRLFMTVAGIMGCMALLLFGFAVRDSVTDLLPRQYENVYRYDVMAAGAASDNDKILSYVNGDPNVQSALNVQISTVKLKNAAGKEEKAQMIVVPGDEPLAEYIGLYNLKDEEIGLLDGEILVTQNAANVLGFAAGDQVEIQDQDLNQREVTVSGLVRNYLGNNVYMTEKTYESLFGDYEPNGVFLKLSEECSDEIAYADDLGGKEGIVSYTSKQELSDEFSDAFTLINMVVYIVIIMAAALAFVVLFTLSTTNISERSRELATIKVLGFFDREVHLYVNKETMILTAIGIVCGIPLGYAFAQTLTYVLNMPSIYLAVSLHGKSYAMAAGLSFLFAILVDLLTNRSLDEIDPVEALKSVE